jgi:hypothetical protein
LIVTIVVVLLVIGVWTWKIEPPRGRGWVTAARLILIGLVGFSALFWLEVYLPSSIFDEPDPRWVRALRWGFWTVAMVAAAASVLLARRYATGAPSVRPMIASFAVTALALVGLAGALLALSASASEDCDDFRFDSAKWKKVDSDIEKADSDRTVRQKLADNLVRCRTLIGKSRTAVRQLLGPGDEGPVDGGGSSMDYGTGPQRSRFSLDAEYLIVELDRRGVVKHVFLNP